MFNPQHNDPEAASDDPHDDILAKQELEEFEQADEYFGYYGGSEEC